MAKNLNLIESAYHSASGGFRKHGDIRELPICKNYNKLVKNRAFFHC